MRIAITITILIVGAGCSIWQEPYPGWSVKGIRQDQLPSVVKKAFASEHPQVVAFHIEESTLESKNTGYPKAYRLTYVTGNGATNAVIYDEKGQQRDLNFWFEDPVTVKRVGSHWPSVRG